MNLGWLDPTTETISDNERGVILHEFGHTLGLMHEHQSPARGNKITLDEAAVIRFYTLSQGWSPEEVKAQVIDVYKERDVSNYSDIDLTSIIIMQYFMPPQLNKQHIRVDPNNQLSELDKAFMIINYPHFDNVEKGQYDPKRGQFEDALDTVGVVGNRKEKILNFYDTHNWSEVRYEFTRFTTDMHLSRKAALASAYKAPRDVDSPEVMTDADALPKVAPTKESLIKQATRTLFHEIGHGLGLKHEHVSPYTNTIDKPDTKVSAATIFDDKSVMLYANRELRATPGFQKIEENFKPESTKYNHVPSDLDYAFIGALYPKPKGHVDDRLIQNLQVLDLANSVTALGALRDAAFAVGGLVQFSERVRVYRQALKEHLAARVLRRAIEPSHTVVPRFRAAAVSPPSTPTTGSFLEELVKNLQSVFQPTNGQLFALQFPGRFLQKDLYAWDTQTAGIYGQFVKPTVVNESEFRLVDQLYDVGTVVGAPNGVNLSLVYEQCLNNLVPGVQESAINLSKQQSQIRKWLLKPVPTSGWVMDLISSQHSQYGKGPSSSGTADAARSVNASSSIGSGPKPQFSVANKLSDDNKINRMEVADALMQEYLAAKQAWELERDEMIRNTGENDMEALTRKLAHTTAIREAQLAAKYGDAVVRGYSYAIRQYLGFVDVKSPAELLQDAKDALRESAVSSLDGSMKVYPVQMSPIDWFQSLSTSFTMEDLTVNSDVIAQQLDIKSKQLDVLNTRLAVIQGKPKTNLQEIQNKLDAAQTTYDNVQIDLVTTYTSNVISLAKTFIDADNNFLLSEFTAAAKKAKIADAAFANIEDGMGRLAAAQLAVTQSSRALTTLMSEKWLAEASDTSQEIVGTQAQITALSKDITELTTRLRTLRNSGTSPSPSEDSSKSSSVNDVELYPPPTSSSGGSRWQEIYMNHMVDSKYTASSNKSQASVSNTDVGLWFGSYHSESSQSSATSTETTSNVSLDVEVGFRATMVTVDRGGWFQPQFFKQSAGFHSIDPKTTWSKWPANIQNVDDLIKDNGRAFTELNKHLLPAFPVGFIVCKDITIRIHMTDTEIKSQGEEMEKNAATSKGILCWSTSSSDSEKSSEKSYSFVQKSDGYIVRIPGPQILGYMLQLTDNDESTGLPDKLPEGFLLSDKDYEDTINA